MSAHATLVEQFGTYSSILKIRGHPHRSDFLYLTDEPGYFTIYRWDPRSQDGTKVLLDEEPVTDSSASGDFLLHPFKPWIVYSRRGDGEQGHSLCLLNYKARSERYLVPSVGTVEFLVPFDAERLIAVVATREKIELLSVSYEGELRELFTTREQVLSIAASEVQKVVAIAVGRAATEILLLDPRDGAVTQRITETEASKEGCLTIEGETGCLAYTTNAMGDGEEIVIRSLETFGEVKRIPVPGSLGFFDLNYLEWVNGHELLAAVAKDGMVSPRLLSIADAAWSPPLTGESAIYLARTAQGIVWVATDFDRPEFVQGYRDGSVETVIPPSLQNKSLVVENHWYASFDDRQIQGWLMRNRDRPKAPLIVMCHGGPTDAVVNEWGEPLAQMLVQGGYHVFQPNFRGSTTFGLEFLNLQIGDVGGGDLQDVLYGANYVHALLELDTQPIILGISYGGYLTLHALTTQPVDWAGGVAIVPFSDWTAKYESANAHYRRYCEHLLGGTPEVRLELYRERSPITHLADLTKPLLILTGDDDANYADVRAFTDAAKSMAKPVHLVVQETGHGTSTADQMNAEIVHSLDFLRTLDVSGG
jgi:dipeptidyl aminopeptidase/acylaminoacyl peptidase